ncbi:MAG: SMP-30/gluconolactonase/LRE family protein [Vicinamibacterales bacterium]|nr:SMP-30/gluconolactonase/LRE family protein [Vicinamibacterales bacterium]
MSIVRLDPALDALLPVDARVEKLAGGFAFTEGPIWRPEGVLWFSDVIGNVTREWSPNGTVKELLRPGGYDGHHLPAGGFVGPNGATASTDGTVVMCQHGNRRVVRIDRNLRVSTVVDQFEGRKLNSPNDVVYRSDGSLYFTDPPYGLPLADDDPSKELPFNGVFRLQDGKLTLLIDDMTRPNGLAFSPDEKTLYVANSDDKHRVWRRYDVSTDGSVRNGRVFADVTAAPDEGLPDGMKIDSQGNLWATGPGGVWIFTPEGKHLGTIKPPEQPANCAWGDADWKTLYITAVTGLYRVRTSVTGQRLVYS